MWTKETGLTSGTSLVFTVIAGTPNYQIGAVSGSSMSSTGGAATVGASYAIVVVYSTPTSATTSSSSASTSTFHTD